MPELLRRFHRGTDFHARFLTWQAWLPGGGQRSRRYLILDQYGGGAGSAISANGALNVHGIAVPMISVGKHHHLRGRATHHVEGIKHLREGYEIEIGSPQSARCNART